MDSFEITMDYTEKRYKKIYKSSLTYWLWHDKIWGKIFALICILCALDSLMYISDFIANPHNYTILIMGFGMAAFGFLIPWMARYLLYIKHEVNLKLIVTLRFSRHEYIVYHPTYEIKTPYAPFKKLVETDKYLLLYPAQRKQLTIFFPLYIFSEQQLELLKEWIKNDIGA